MNKKLSFILAALMLTTLMFSSCNRSNPPSEPSSSDSPISEPSESSEESSESSSAPTVQIYDPETQKVSQVPVEEGESNAKVTDEELVKILNDKFAFKAGDNEFKIIINSIKENGSGLYVDFAGNSIPAVSMGSSEEEACLISIAETLLKNHPSCSQVYYTIDGGTYMSGHIELDLGEPFRYDSKLS